jgi:hypothetical protein
MNETLSTSRGKGADYGGQKFKSKFDASESENGG